MEASHQLRTPAALTPVPISASDLIAVVQPLASRCTDWAIPSHNATFISDIIRNKLFSDEFIYLIDLFQGNDIMNSKTLSITKIMVALNYEHNVLWQCILPIRSRFLSSLHKGLYLYCFPLCFVSLSLGLSIWEKWKDRGCSEMNCQ
jgi:hypothetical protein